MKIILIVLTLIASGCATGNRFDTQKILTDALPSTFVGNAKIEHKNPYFDFIVDVRGLKKLETGEWKWDSISYVRNGRFSIGKITLSPEAIP